MAPPGPQRSFAEMFGGATTDIDYGNPQGGASAILPTPEPTDSLDVAASKMEALARVVEAGKSLAVATGYNLAKHSGRDAAQNARAGMTPAEVDQYDAWKQGVNMPEFDWVAYRKPAPSGPGTQRRYEERALAMDEIWGHEGATIENVAWMMANMIYAIPLVTAVARVRAARRDMTGGEQDLTALEMAEIQTAHRVVAIATNTMNEVFAQMKNLSRSINHSKDVIQAREHALKTKLPGYIAKSDPINDQRQFMGRPAIGAHFEGAAVTAGKRVARADPLVGSGIVAVPPSGGQADPPRERQATPVDARGRVNKPSKGARKPRGGGKTGRGPIHGRTLSVIDAHDDVDDLAAEEDAMIE